VVMLSPNLVGLNRGLLSKLVNGLRSLYYVSDYIVCLILVEYYNRTSFTYED